MKRRQLSQVLCLSHKLLQLYTLAASFSVVMQGSASSYTRSVRTHMIQQLTHLRHLCKPRSAVCGVIPAARDTSDHVHVLGYTMICKSCACAQCSPSCCYNQQRHSIANVDKCFHKLDCCLQRIHDVLFSCISIAYTFAHDIECMFKPQLGDTTQFLHVYQCIHTVCVHIVVCMISEPIPSLMTQHMLC
jgi:hypothetical protein